MSAPQNWRHFAARPPAPKRDLLGPKHDYNAEARQQAAVVEWCRWVRPDVIVFHVPNGGLRSKPEAARLKWMGVLAGVLDLVLILPDGRSAYWECKTPVGRLSDDQKKFIAHLERMGHSWGTVRTIEDARAELTRLGIETKETSR